MIVMPAMGAGQEAAWHALLDLHEVHPTGWTLIGGQLVHLHCAERASRLCAPPTTRIPSSTLGRPTCWVLLRRYAVHPPLGARRLLSRSGAVH